MVSLSALPALQIDTQMIDAEAPLRAFRMGAQDQIADNQRALAKEVGAEAASGNYLAAARRAFQGGDLQTGQAFNKYKLDLDNMSQDQRLKVAKFMIDAGGRADTPEKWKVYTGMASNIFGQESVAPYLDFNNRPGAMTEMERVTAELENQIKRAQLTPQSFREWQAFQSLSPEDQDRYTAFKQQSGQSRTTYGTTPYYTVDGKPYVTGNDGSVKYLDLGGAEAMGPEGAAAARERGKATGKVVGQAKAELPGVIQNSTQMLGMLNSLKRDPYLSRMLGPVDSRTPDLSADAGRVASKIDQINGAAFLQAFESLKGGGQITEIEGLKATQAISRLTNRNMDPEDYKVAIEELEHIIRNGVIRARVDAGEIPQSELGQLRNFEDAIRTPSGEQIQAPSVGEVIDGYRFKGGNPADPNSWEKQ